MRSHSINLSVLFSVIFLLSACGGGGGSSGGSSLPVADRTPDSFNIPIQADVPLNSAVESAPVKISGINSPASVTITGGTYSIAGAAYTSAAGNISNGQTITVRLTSSPNYQTKVTATLTVGGVSANFVVTTIADTVKPTATIVFPPFDHTVADTSKIIVRGTASDNAGVQSVSVNGVKATTNDNYATWQATVNLTANQSNALTVSATDIDGNTDAAAATTNVFDENGWRVCDVSFGYDKTNNLIYAGVPLSRFDVSTNTQQTLVPVHDMQFDAIAYDPGGDRLFGLSGGALYEVNISNGNTSTVSPQGSNGVNINSAHKLTFAAGTGLIYLVDTTDLSVISINTADGSRAVISGNSNAGPAYDSESLLSFSNGRLFASTGNTSAVAPTLMEVNLTTGDKTVISDKSTGTGQDFRSIEGLGVDAVAGKAYVADYSGDMLQVDLGSGNRSVLSEHDNWINDGLTWEQFVGLNLDTADGLAYMYDCDIDQLISVNLSNGTRSQITVPYRGTGRPLVFPSRVAYDPNDDQLMTINHGGVLGTASAPPLQDSHAIVSVAPATGDRTLVANDATGSGGAFGNLVDITYDAMNDRILVIDQSNVAILSVNPFNGLKTTISDNTGTGTGPIFSHPNGIAVTTNGTTAYVVDTGSKSILAVDLATGNRTIVSDNSGTGSGPAFDVPTDIVLNANDTIAYVTNQAGASIYSVSLSDGTRSVVSSSTVGSGTALVEPSSLAIDTVNKRLFVIDISLTGIMTIDINTGARTISNSTGALTTSANDVVYDTSRGLVFAAQIFPYNLVAFDPETYSAVIVSQ